MKVFLIYNGSDSSNLKELEMDSIPRVGDGFSVNENAQIGSVSTHYTVESVDWYVKHGQLMFVEIYLSDER